MMDGHHWMGGMQWGWLFMVVIIVLLVILIINMRNRR